MPITPVIPTSNRVPGSYIAVQLGVGRSSAGDGPRRVLVVGYMLSSGAWTANAPVPVFDVDSANAGAGRGSELARMIARAFGVYRGATLYALPLTAPDSAAATKQVVFADGPASASGTVVVEIGGERIEVFIASGTTATNAGVAVRDAINALPDLPVTAAAATGTVTITARHHGTRGNRISVRSSGTVTGLTITHASGYMASGTGTDSLATPLAAIDPERYHLIAIPHDDTTAIQAFRSHVNAAAAPEEGRRQQVVCGTQDTLANAITLATAINAARVQVAWHYNADDTPGEVAAAVAARRALLEGADPAAPMSQVHGTDLPGVRPQPVVADRPIGSELQSALNNGLTPISMDNAGNCYVCRSITSRSQDTSGNPDYRVYDTAKVTVSDHVADRVESWWAGFVQLNGKAAPDDPDGEPPPPGVCTPATVKDGIYGEVLKPMEPQMVVNVDENLPNLVVELADAPDGRFLALIPSDVVEGAYQLAAAVQQVG